MLCPRQEEIIMVYVISLAMGLLVGVIYGLFGVRSPAPPVIALVGLFGILLGEQLVPIVKHAVQGRSVSTLVRTGCSNHVLGRLPTNDTSQPANVASIDQARKPSR
jgi:XapX domain-containing protein